MSYVESTVQKVRMIIALMVALQGRGVSKYGMTDVVNFSEILFLPDADGEI